MRRRLSRLGGEWLDRSAGGTLPGLLPRLTGETRFRFKLERLGNEPEAGGED